MCDAEPASFSVLAWLNAHTAASAVPGHLTLQDSSLQFTPVLPSDSAWACNLATEYAVHGLSAADSSQGMPMHVMVMADSADKPPLLVAAVSGDVPNDTCTRQMYGAITELVANLPAPESDDEHDTYSMTGR